MLFKDLSTPAQLVYHVTRRIKNHKTNSFFHSVETIADHIGKSESTARKGLSDLVNAGILTKTERTGRTTVYTFIAEARLSEQAPTQNLHPTPLDSTPHPPKIYTHNNSDLTDSDLTTTWLSDKTKSKLITDYGKQAVYDRVVVISKMNGQVKNKAGLLVHSLKNDYIPASKEMKEAKQREDINKAVEAEIERNRIKYQQWNDERENIDPNHTVDLVSEFSKIIKSK